MGSFDPAKTAFSRVFIVKERAGPANRPQYMSCMRAGSVDQSFGDIETIECPDDSSYGKFVEIGSIRGAKERASSSLIGQYASDLRSELLAMARQMCEVDVQIHFGNCTDPRAFNSFTKALVWEQVALGDYSTDDLGALSADENSKITETSNLSIKDFYEVLPMTFQRRANDLSPNTLVDAVICDLRTCGDCDTYSEGYRKAFVLHGGIIGSPGTAVDVLYTEDAGAIWGSDEINVFGSGEEGDALACLGDYLVVVSADAVSLAYKEKSEILDGTVGGWTEIATGFVGAPTDIWSVGTGAFIVGESGYVYWTDAPADGVEVLDAGIAAGAATLHAVHALDESTAVAVGASDTIVFTINGVIWGAATATGNGGTLSGVWMRSATEWWVTTLDGELYYTLNSGTTWTEKNIPGVGITALYDVQFSTPSVGYVAGVASGVGALWRTYDGGYSWVRLPEGVGTLPGAAVAYHAVAATPEEANFLIAAGEGAADTGVLLVGVA